MTLNPISKRDLKNVGANIWNAIAVMEGVYGAQLTHDSGHGQDSDEQATTWIFTFPRFNNAQIAVPMNRQKLSFLMRGTSLDGRQLGEIVLDIAKVEKKYINPERGVASSVLGSRAPYLNPSPKNPLLRVNPNPNCVQDLLRLYLGVAVGDFEKENVTDERFASPWRSAVSRVKHRTVTADELQLQLDRNAQTGTAGESIAIAFELERLRKSGCPSPEAYVSRVALSDVGRGYDIHTNWNGDERCIEVKSTTVDGSDFFLTDNECTVLEHLGNRAWLYRVLIKDDGSGTVKYTMQNPIAAIASEYFSPVVWRIDGKAIRP